MSNYKKAAKKLKKTVNKHVIENSNGGFTLTWDKTELISDRFRVTRAICPPTMSHKNHKKDIHSTREKGKKECRNHLYG